MTFQTITPTDADPANDSGDVTFTQSNGTGVTLKTTTNMDYGIANSNITNVPSGETLFSLGAETDALQAGEIMTHSITDASGDPAKVSGARLTFDNLSDTGTSAAIIQIESFFVILDGVQMDINAMIASGEASITWGDPLGVQPGLGSFVHPFVGGKPDPNAIDPFTMTNTPTTSPDGAIHGSTSSLGLTLTINREFSTLALDYSNTDNGRGTHYRLELDDTPPIPCFLADTLIETKRGPIQAIDVVPGDLLLCADGAYRPVAWVGTRQIGIKGQKLNPKFQPVRIKAGALGLNMPEKDLLVSRQHRILIRSEIAQTMFGCDELLIAAVKLTGLPNIAFADDLENPTYVHFLMEGHQIIFANGLAAETLFLGTQASKILSEHSLEEIYAIFPELRMQNIQMDPAYFIPEPNKQKELVCRHQKNPMRSLSGRCTVFAGGAETNSIAM